MIIIGIDPGFKGALAFLDTEKSTLSVDPMPTHTRGKAIGKKFVDEDVLTSLILSRVGEEYAEAIIEDVYSSPQMGVTSSFSFGEGKGVLKGVLGACTVLRHYVSPAKWKGDMRLPSDKKQTIQMVHRMLPLCAEILKKDGKAEAAAIALWWALTKGIVLPRVTPLVLPSARPVDAPKLHPDQSPEAYRARDAARKRRQRHGLRVAPFARLDPHEPMYVKGPYKRKDRPKDQGSRDQEVQ